MAISNRQPDSLGTRQTQRQGLVGRLQKKIHRVETARRVGSGDQVSTGCRALDGLLPGGGHARGTLVQWFASGGLGADYLSLLTAREACRAGGALVVVDSKGQFYPPAAAALGIDMGNLILLRPPARGKRSPRPAAEPATDLASHPESDWFWAIDQALRCPAVAAVWGPLGSIDERWFRRFQLSAESSGCLGVFVQTPADLRQPSWAEVQWLALPRDAHQANQFSEPPPDSLTEAGQRLRVQLVRCRGTHTGKGVELMIDNVAGETTSTGETHG